MGINPYYRALLASAGETLPEKQLERKEFPCSDGDCEIILHPDGSLTIETHADYGDSEIGWGEAHKTIFMDRQEVAAFIEFLQG